MTYREHAHRSLKISLDSYRDQVKSMNDTIIGNLGEPYKVKGPSLKQRLRGYRHLTERGRLDYLRNAGKTISDYLIYFGKCFSTFFPGIGEGIFYREIRKCGGSRKESLAMSSIFGCSKIPLFIFPCEETLALYTGISVVGSIGIALYSTDNQSKKINDKKMR